MVETILSVRNLTQQFKGVLAVDHIRMDLEKGGIYGLIGTNGAGKSTVINMISGSIPPTEGEILFGGKDIGKLDAAGRAKAGIARTFQNLRLFSGQTVLDNRSPGNTTCLKCWPACRGTAGKKRIFPNGQKMP